MPNLPMMEFEPLTLEQQAERLREQSRLWKRKLGTAYSRFEFRGYERDELECVLGFKAATEKLLASNLKLRVAASETLAALFGQLREDSLAIPGRRFCFGSFLGPLVNERSPVLDVDAFRAAIYKVILGERLNAVFAIELQTLTNYPQRRQGISFLMNAHALLWTGDANFDAVAAQQRMRRSKRLKSELGARTVRLTERSLDEGQLEYAGRYMLKPPVDGKYRALHDEIPTRWVLNPVADVRDTWLMRLAEILSPLEFTDLAWGVNDGTKIRAQWKQRLVAWNKAQCARCKLPLERDFDIQGLWNGIRARPGNGSRLYLPVIFQGRRPQR